MRVHMTVLACLVLLTLQAVPGFGSVPSQITVQGKVTDAAGAPLPAGVKSFVFRIFNASTGGSQIWPSVGSEAQSISTNVDGLWSGQLGAVNPLTDAVFADSVRWLEITVNGELLPRIRLVTAPYAMRVSTVDGAAGGGVTSNMAITSNLYLKGTALGAASGCWVQFNDGGGTAMGYIGDGSDDDQDLYLYAYVGNLKLTTSSGIVLTAGSNGNVGIGTAPSSGDKLKIVQPSGTTAVYGFSSNLNGIGVEGRCDNGGVAYGIYGVSATGFAGRFSGAVDVAGTLSKNAGSFKIDHPLDPANKYLSHSFVESPDMMNIYNGIAVTNANGDVTVTMPDWFDALNRDFRYQLTVIGQFAQAIISKKLVSNAFSIKTDKPNVEVSWQVTGIRQDAYANAHRIPVEEFKPTAERGFYRNPAVLGQPEEKDIDWARHPEMMRQMKDERAKANASE